MKQWALQLLDYHNWANLRMLDHCAGLPEDCFVRETDSVFPTVRRTFLHMLEVDRLWLTRLRGHSPAQFDPPSLERIADIRTAALELHGEIREHLSGTDVSATVVYRNTKGESFRNSALEIVQHIVNHGTYHRGNIAAMLRQMGQPGTSTDYIVYLREKEHGEQSIHEH